MSRARHSKIKSNISIYIAHVPYEYVHMCIIYQLEFGNVGFLEETGKPKYPEKNLSEQGREPTTPENLQSH